MRIQFLIFLITYFLATIVNGASKYYDGPIRPYEFGYSIEGNQHRHEQKDENGIIMGEFGFITADGVYHVTVYATDENGNFKILSMKNIKIGLPEETKGARISPSVTGSATTSAPLSTISLPTKPQLKTKKRKPGAAISCSSCLIPKAQQLGEDNSEDQLNFDPRSSAKTTQNSGGKGVNALQSPKGSSGSENNLFSPLSKKLNNNAGGTRLNNQGQAAQSPIGSSTSSDRTTTQQQQSKVSGTGSQVNGENLLNNRKSFDQGQQSSSGGRNEVSTPSLSGEPPLGKSVGEGEGGVLYKFNYTVGYHGHHEQGDYEGIKDGGYNFVGRDGLRRTIDYLANEFGYQPYLTLDKVDEKDIPKPETEKEAGLKGYEFKWFNKPKQ